MKLLAVFAKTMDKISIIIATYNNSEILEASLRSYDNLEIPEKVNVELIVVDNNSTDKTFEVITNYRSSNLCRVEYVFEGRQGKSFALIAHG